ncbi:chemotaxis protein CheR [Mycolicibacterium litorale]|nr:chemotaxis protein CheR [Mycolicibacterium litorale]
MVEHTDEAFEGLLAYLRDSGGFDFTGYKRTSLMRRVRHRMGQIGCETFEDYLDVLQAQPDEFSALFNTILINVTTFFRDPQAWDVIRDHVIPQILAERAAGEPIRVWSAGCASGQEAYTLAMLLAEALGEDDFRRRVSIYATDVDEEALAQARAASYDAKAVESVPPELLAKYFEQVNGRFVFREDLRRSMIFGRNDLVKDAPISRVDLLVCPNTLMYLNSETQRNVLSRLHFALAPNGTLFLGHAEMLHSHTDEFSPLDIKNRIFRKANGSSAVRGLADLPSAVPDRPGEIDELAPIRELALRAGPLAQIVATGADTVAMINQQAEATFGLSGRDVGRSLRDLEISYRPVELRAYIEQAKMQRRSVRIQDVQYRRPGGEVIWFEVHVNPLVDPDNGLLGVSIVYSDVTATRALLDRLVDSARQLEVAYGELQSTNEKLETSNEELQSTVEELETTNEELQSTNEELHTINDAVRQRSAELDKARTLLGSLVDSVDRALVVVDREMRVLAWNHGCGALWGVRADEAVGTSLTALDIGLPMGSIRPLIGDTLADAAGGEVSVQAVDQRGTPTRIRVTCWAFRSAEGSVTGALLFMAVV